MNIVPDLKMKPALTVSALPKAVKKMSKAFAHLLSISISIPTNIAPPTKIHGLLCS